MKFSKIIIPSLILLMSCDKEPTKTTLIPELSFKPDSISVSVGQQGHLTLQLKDLQVSIFGISMSISYDSAIVSLYDSAGFTIGDFFGTDIVNFVRDESSTIYLTITLTQGQEEVTGSGNLGGLTLVGICQGTTNVEIVSSELYFYNSDGDEVMVPDLEIVSATFTVR